MSVSSPLYRRVVALAEPSTSNLYVPGALPTPTLPLEALTVIRVTSDAPVLISILSEPEEIPKSSNVNSPVKSPTPSLRKYSAFRVDTLLAANRLFKAEISVVSEPS